MPDINVKPNDLEILWVEPGVDGTNPDADARAPTAQELAGTSHLSQQNLKKQIEIERPTGLRTRPNFTATTGSKGVILPAGLTPFVPGQPSFVPFASPVTVTLPALADTSSSVSRYDRLYLLCFGAEVTGAIDSDINLAFEWANPSGVIQTLTKENTRRLRSFWAIVWSQGATTADAVYNALPTVSSKKTLTVAKNSTGTALGSTLRIYPLDPNLTDTKAYVVRQDLCQLIDLCRVWRVQNFTQAGYVWGRNGEKDFEPDFHIQPTYRYVGDGWDDWQARSRETLRRILLGRPLIESPTYDRAVSNLLNGQVGANLDAPGVATASPNGSTALANGQRVSFTNQAIVQKTYCLPVQTVNASGFARADVPFQTNSPTGAQFSQNAADHKVWTATGVDVSADGTLTGLGGTGSLSWTANSNAVVAVGDVVYFQPGIVYPAGSGFAVSGDIEKVYLDAATLAAGNVREASVNDLTAYAAPVSSENFFAVVGKERGALHYILKRITVASSSGGVVAIPSTERGVIAFISGAGAPSGRIDKPVITGLSASTNYNLLIYYPPQSTENWQFQVKCSRYAGSGEKTFVNGSSIATHPVAIAHTQGGGNGTFLAEGEFQYEVLSNRLPANTLSAAVKAYLANYRIAFVNEPEVGANSVREIMLSSAPGLAVPRVGMQLATVDAANAQTKGIAARLQNSAAQVLGVLKLPIQCSQVYQLLIAFLIAKGSDRRLVIVTLNEGNLNAASSIRFDSDSPGFAGIDTFYLY